MNENLNGNAPVDGPAEPAGTADLTAQTGPDAPATRKQILVRLGVVVVVLAGLGLAGNWLVRNPLGGVDTVEEYLAWAGTGGALGLFVAQFGVLIRSVTGDDRWELLSHTGKLFASMWVVIISIATASV